MKITRKVAIGLYILVILYFTLFTRESGSRQLVLEPFWELKKRMYYDISMNILLFVPLGIFLVDWKKIWIGTALSALIEAIQYLFHLGYCEVDDVINNSLGLVIGIVLIKLVIVGAKYCAKKMGRSPGIYEDR